jgi:acetyltransferase
MVGEDAVLDAAFQRAGIERIYKMEEMFDCAELLARHAPPRGARLAIVTNAGGPGVMATDTLLAERGKLAALSDGTIARLNEFLPASWSHGNPVDVLGDAPPERFARAVEVVLADPLVDAALVILTPQAMTAPRETAEAVAKIAAEGAKPVLAAWVGGRRVQSGRAVLGEAGLPNYATPEQAVQAFMHLVSYARNLEMLYETPRPVPLAFPAGREQFDKQFRAGLQAGPGVLSEVESKRLLQAYGIPVTETFVARSADEAAERAEQVGYPVVLKVHSPQITHKTDVGGVKLNLANPADVRQAFEQIMSTAHSRRPEAHLEGVSVQPMADLKQGIELILGMKKDPTVGPVLMIGAGGVTAELFHDRALGLPPLNERLAYRMLQGLRSWPLLQGYRGKPPVNLDQLIELLLRFSHLVAWHPELKEFDINPLLVTPQAALALDARAVVDRAVLAHPLPPYAHLVIRPYPEEYIRQAALMNRTEVILRPIGPEDEPRWHQLLAACSAESLHARFRYLFKTVTHEMASRYCFIDYDRELAIVAEVKDTGEFAGIGRLVADPGHETAEFAILVADRWQGQGLGMMLTDYCLEIARDWEIGCVTAVTNFDNARMVSIFAERGFQIDWAAGGDLMARKVLT